jgi:RimJ/RimL family protein N-acetyltransferase
MTTSYTVPTLMDGNLRLRAPHMDDVAARLEAGNVVDIQHMYGVDPSAFRPETEQGATAWVSYHVNESHSWFIDIDGRLSGLIFLHSLDHTDKRATVAMGLLRPEQLNKGYGSRAMHLLLGEAFGPLDLHRVSLRVLAYNARALAAYKKVGFTEEGRERQSAKVGDRFHDDVMMGMLAHEYCPMKQATQ